MSQEPLPPNCLVLCVEDDPDVMRLIQTILGLGSAVRILGSPRGWEALDLVKNDPPDLILLDLRLPDLSGAEVLRRLKADECTRRIPVIMLSAERGTELTAHLMELGATQCLQKPFGLEGLLAAIEAAANTG